MLSLLLAASFIAVDPVPLPPPVRPLPPRATAVSADVGADEPSRIEVEGEIETVKVATVVYVDLPLVKRLPVTLVAPSGFRLYLWSVPSNITYRGQYTNRLEILKASDGPLLVEVALVPANFEIEVASTTITIGKPPPPPNPPTITDFAITPSEIPRGKVTFVRWATSNADTVTFDGQPVALSGQLTIAPGETRAYVLEASRDGHTVKETRIVTVTDLPPPPIAEPGFRVMIIEDVFSRKDLPTDQYNVIMSTAPGSFREFLLARAVKVHGVPDLRFISHTNPLDQDAPYWQAAAKLPRDSYPWLIVSNGKAGYSGPLPKTTAEALALVRPFAE